MIQEKQKDFNLISFKFRANKYESKYMAVVIAAFGNQLLSPGRSVLLNNDCSSHSRRA